MKAEPASVLAPSPVLESLSGEHGCWGYDLGSHNGSPNHGAIDSSAYFVTEPSAVGVAVGSTASCIR